METKEQKLIILTLAFAVAFVGLEADINAQEAAKPTITVSGAQAGSDANYYIVEVPEEGATKSVTITASGQPASLTAEEKCKCNYNGQSSDPDKDGSLKYTFTKTIGNQDPADGPTVKIDVSSSTSPGEYKFKVTNIEQKYKACSQNWTGGITTKNNTQASDEVTVLAYKIQSETIATTPSDRKRKTLGIGEEVKFTIQPSPTSATWVITAGDGSINSSSGNTTQLTASQSPGSVTVQASIKGVNKDTTLTVIAPNGMNSTLNSDQSYGAAGQNYIGARSNFDCTVQPTTVSFYKAKFQENIPGDSWTWPDGTSGSRAAAIVPWSTGYNNTTTDTVGSALAPTNRIKNSSGFTDFSISIRVPEEYKDKDGNWTSWLSGETHPRNYRGADQQAKVSLQATNTAEGGWMGPWKP